MESSYLLEKKVISICFNPIRDSVFILSIENDRLELTEEDLSKNIILRRYKLLKTTECLIQNNNYRVLPKDTYEGYSLYFWELKNKIIVIFPCGYLLIYDYSTAQLNYHFQCHGRKAYVIRNIVGSPMQENLFISAEGMRNVYLINYQSIQTGIQYQKLVLPQNENVYDLVCHPNEKFVFIACTDSIVHIFDYSDIAKIKEVKNGIVDIPLSTDGKVPKNQSEQIKKSNLQSVITLDINSTGNYLLTGNENGIVYLWDAFYAMKDKRRLMTKQKVSANGIFSVKFLKMKQFQNLERFICLTKDGKFFIYSIISKDKEINKDIASLPNNKSYIFNILYENSTYNQILYPMSKYNLMTSSFITTSYFSNVISLTWPHLKMDKIKTNDKYETYLLFPNFSAKFFYLYDNDFPKINFALSTQMQFRPYEEYIPQSKKMLVYESRIFMIDNFFIYVYEILTGKFKKLINYTKEFTLKAVCPLKFEIREIEGEQFMFILIENENNKKSNLMIHYNMIANVVKRKERLDDIIDFLILGNDYNKSEYVYMIHKDRQNGIVYSINDQGKVSNAIDASVVRIYHTPFANGYCVLYRNVLNELKFSTNMNDPDQFAFKSLNEIALKLDFNEREIDVVFNTYDNRIYCAISMIEKIIITDETLRTLYTIKIELNGNPNIISSMFWVGKTLIYTKGTSICYFYGEDNINQKIFTNNLPSTFIAGVLPDRFILVSKGRKDIDSIVLTTPAINPLEPLLIGYLDNPKLDYNLLKECVTNMFTNQVSQHLIDKFIKMDLKEVAWMFLSDSKSSFQNIDKKVNILNDLLKFDMVLENIITNRDLKNEMHLDELIWRFNYDQSYENVKSILQKESDVLIQFGQFDKAVKILELLGDYPKTLELLLIATSREEYEKLRVMFQAKGCMNFTDNLLINNNFFLQSKPDNNSNYNMTHYSKVFDNYKNEHFIFGANQDRFTIDSIQGIENKLNKRNSYITNISKKILSFGETSFAIYVNAFNKEAGNEGPCAVCNIILQKIEQFYGYKNTVYEEGGVRHIKKADFHDFNVPLTQIQSMHSSSQQDKQNNPNENANGNNGEGGYNQDQGNGNGNNNIEDDDVDMDPNTEDINEAMYLSAYYHCDKGSGVIVEDITDNGNDATLSYIDTQQLQQQQLQQQQQQQQQQGQIAEVEENILWTNVLDEFEPLEYEDKWGRKSPGAHSIRFSKKSQTKMHIKYTPSFCHWNTKFTIEMWVKLNSFNITLLTKDTLNIEIQNGQFKLNFQSNLLQGNKLRDYSLQLNQFFHIAIAYKKKEQLLKIFINCEEIITFPLSLDTIPLVSELVIGGNGNLDAEITEVKIWNVEMPKSFLKENYKSPLPILAENKRKLRMKINKQDDNRESQAKKKFEFNRNAFQFGGNKPQDQAPSGSLENNKGLYEFNPNNYGTNNNTELDNSISYPSLSNSVMDDISIQGHSSGVGVGGKIPNDNHLHFGFKFDEVNPHQNYDMNIGDNTHGNPETFNFQINDFNFDK